jgi:hypothetical protein
MFVRAIVTIVNMNRVKELKPGRKYRGALTVLFS